MPAMIKKPRKIILVQNGPSPDLSRRIVLGHSGTSSDLPRRIILEHSGPSPDLPVQFKNRVTELSGHDLKYLMHKRLFCSDVRPNNNRLSMPMNEIMCEFLTQDEIEKLDEPESSQYEQLLEFLQLSEDFLIEETRTANALAFLYDHFGLRLLQAYLREANGIEDLPLNAMVGKILSRLLYCCSLYSKLYKT